MQPDDRGATEPVLLDTRMHGIAGSTAAFVVTGEQTALVDTGPRSSLPAVLDALDAVTDRLDWIVLTHIHLDHAGAAGALAARFPSARVAVHPRGAAHLADPSRLWASVVGIYGLDAERLWGGIDPVPSARLHVVRDGDAIPLGGRSLRVLETAGHARHHHAYLDDETGIVFAGDALGMQLAGSEGMRPATAPPEHDLQQALASIDRIRCLRPAAVWLSHFGPATHDGRADATDEICDRAAWVLECWHRAVESARRGEATSLEDLVAAATADLDALERRLPAEVVETLDATNSRALNVAGIDRYLQRLTASDPRTKDSG
jgi:glyoxylase-like metal-dependent hydrolase (beta-lactamase superfamily II)